MKVPRADRASFILLAGLILGYVTARAVLVPITHDESTSFLAYAQPGTFLPFASMWDANNHYLSTALGMLGYRVMGFSWFALRWASVLAFVVYAWGAWRMGRWVTHRGVCWTLWCALLLCPMALDFFALYRGYGIAMAGTLLALEAVVRYNASGESTAWRTALLGLLAANLALLAWIPLWGMLLLVLAVAAWNRRSTLDTRDRWRKALWWIFAGAIPFACTLALALFQHRLGLLYYGGTAGFIPVTIGSLDLTVLGADTWWVRAMVVSLFAGSLVVAWRQQRRSGWGSPLMIIGIVLVTEVIARIGARHLIGLNYPEDRTALHLLLLFTILLALAIDALVVHDRRWLLLTLLLWYPPMRSMATADLEHTVLWPEQSIPERFVRHAHSMTDTLGRPAIVGAYRLAGHPWSLQARHCGLESDASGLGFPRGAHDLRVVDARYLAEARIGYTVIDSAPANDLYLLQRGTPIVPLFIAEAEFSFNGGGRELIEACQLDARTLCTNEGLVDAQGALDAEVPLAEVRIAVVVTDSLGAVLHNDLVFLGTRRERWVGEGWRILRPLPVLPTAHRLQLYFWNPLVRSCTVREGRLKLFRSMNGDHTSR